MYSIDADRSALRQVAGARVDGGSDRRAWRRAAARSAVGLEGPARRVATLLLGGSFLWFQACGSGGSAPVAVATDAQAPSSAAAVAITPDPPLAPDRVEPVPGDAASSDEQPAPPEPGVPQRPPATDGIAAESLAFRIADVPDPLLERLQIPPDAPQKGMWTALNDWPLLPLAASLLPDGRVVTFGSPVGGDAFMGRVFDIWDPTLGFTADAHMQLPNAQGVNSFCAGTALLADGRLLVSGGDEPRESSVVDAQRKQVSRTPSMASDRWYGTLITLADGRHLMAGGSYPYFSDGFADPAIGVDAFDFDDVSDRVAMTPEIYSPRDGWKRLVGATSREAFGPDSNRYWYPRAWVAADGKVFGLSGETLWRLDADGSTAQGAGTIEILGTFKEGVNERTRPNVGASSTAVMFAPGRILQVGGNGYRNGANAPGDKGYTYRTSSSKAASVIELGDGSVPTVRDVEPMHEPRQWANATVLPDGRVLVDGGTRFANYGDDAAVREVELWDPATESWTRGPAAQRQRLYHSSALLLPSGAVFTGGGGIPGFAPQLNAEVYLPPYLFKEANGAATLAERPRILAASALRLAYGDELRLQIEPGLPVGEVALIALGNDTHSFNMSQRRLPLNFEQVGAMVVAQMPARGALAPPGWYMVFVLATDGVPSRGLIVGIGV